MAAVAGTMAVVALLAAVAAAAVSCSGMAPARPPVQGTGKTLPHAASPASTTGRVQIVCEPARAEVLVDGQLRGTAASIRERGGLQLPFGLHRIEIRLAGYQPFRIELEVGERPEVIRVKLEPGGGG